MASASARSRGLVLWPSRCTLRGTRRSSRRNLPTGTTADLWTAVVPVGRLRRELLRVPLRVHRLGHRTNPLDRADADAISFAESSVYRARFCDAHFCAVDQGRDIGRIGITVADKALNRIWREDGRLKSKSVQTGIPQLGDWLDLNATAAPAKR